MNEFTLMEMTYAAKTQSQGQTQDNAASKINKNHMVNINKYETPYTTNIVGPRKIKPQ